MELLSSRLGGGHALTVLLIAALWKGICHALTLDRRVSFFIVSATVLPAHAEKDVAPLIKKGEEAVNAKDYQSAIDYFQQVVMELHGLLGATMGGFMPPALAGWEAGEIEKQSWSGATNDSAQNLTNVSQTFTRKSDGKTCQIAVVNWPEMVTGMKQSVDAYKKMSEMMKSNPEMTMTVEERDGWTILRIVDKRMATTTLNAVSDGAYVMVTANYADATEADRYFAAMNLSGIASLGGTAR